MFTLRGFCRASDGVGLRFRHVTGSIKSRWASANRSCIGTPMPTNKADARDILIAPSILNANLLQLGREIAEVEAGGADWIHIDVMDGRFVPNLALCPSIVRAVRSTTTLPVDVHLMMVEPERYIDDFANAGADLIGVQVEAANHLQRTLERIRHLGKRACAVLNPSTHESSLEYVMEDLDMILVMTVNPGFGGQKLLKSQLVKIERLRERIDRLGLEIHLKVDGGVGPDNARTVVDAGANVLVIGSAIFGAPDRAAAIRGIRDALAR